MPRTIARSDTGDLLALKRREQASGLLAAMAMRRCYIIRFKRAVLASRQRREQTTTGLLPQASKQILEPHEYQRVVVLLIVWEGSSLTGEVRVKLRFNCPGHQS
jgi:hypothetical protein